MLDKQNNKNNKKSDLKNTKHVHTDTNNNTNAYQKHHTTFQPQGSTFLSLKFVLYHTGSTFGLSTRMFQLLTQVGER